MSIVIVGIDLGKNSCSIVGLDSLGTVVVRRRLRRDGVIAFASKLPACIMAMEAFLRELVEQVLDRGTTVVFSTHILSDLERVAFNVAFLREGRIALQSPLDELLEDTRLLIGPDALLASLARLDVLSRRAGRWLVRRVDEAALAPGLVAQRASLEDLFEALT